MRRVPPPKPQAATPTAVAQVTKPIPKPPNLTSSSSLTLSITSDGTAQLVKDAAPPEPSADDDDAASFASNDSWEDIPSDSASEDEDPEATLNNSEANTSSDSSDLYSTTSSGTYRTAYCSTLHTTTTKHSLFSASTGVRSQPGATWAGIATLNHSSGFAAGQPRSANYKGVREGREKEIKEVIGRGLGALGVGRTGKGPVKVPEGMVRAARYHKDAMTSSWLKNDTTTEFEDLCSAMKDNLEDLKRLRTLCVSSANPESKVEKEYATALKRCEGTLKSLWKWKHHREDEDEGAVKVRRNMIKGFGKKLDRVKAGKEKKAASHATRIVEQDDFRLAHMKKAVGKSKLKSASKLLAEIETSSGREGGK